MKVDKQTRLEWEGWEPLILNDLKAAQRKIQLFYHGVADIGVRKPIKEQFVQDRLRELLIKVTEG